MSYLYFDFVQQTMKTKQKRVRLFSYLGQEGNIEIGDTIRLVSQMGFSGIVYTFRVALSILLIAATPDDYSEVPRLKMYFLVIFHIPIRLITITRLIPKTIDRMQQELP